MLGGARVDSGLWQISVQEQHGGGGLALTAVCGKISVQEQHGGGLALTAVCGKISVQEQHGGGRASVDSGLWQNVCSRTTWCEEG